MARCLRRTSTRQICVWWMLGQTSNYKGFYSLQFAIILICRCDVYIEIYMYPNNVKQWNIHEYPANRNTLDKEYAQIDHNGRWALNWAPICSEGLSISNINKGHQQLGSSDHYSLDQPSTQDASYPRIVRVIVGNPNLNLNLQWLHPGTLRLDRKYRQIGSKFLLFQCGTIKEPPW